MKIVEKTRHNLKKKSSKWRESVAVSPWSAILVLVVLSVLISFMLSPYPASTIPRYKPGDVAFANIKATDSFLVEDKESTEKKRRSAADGVLTVYDYDPLLAGRIRAKVPKGFEAMRKFLHDLAGQPQDGKNEEAITGAIKDAREELSQILGIEVDPETFQVLLRGKFSEDFEILILELLDSVINKPIVANKEMLLTERSKGIMVRNVQSGQESRETDFSSDMSLVEARQEIRSVGLSINKNYKYASLQASIRIAQDLIQPNLTLNRQETERRRQATYHEQKPVYYHIEKGEMIVREGGRITPKIVDQLAMLRVKTKERNLLFVVGGLAVLLGLFLLVSVRALKGSITYAIYPLRETLFLASTLLLTFLLTVPSLYISQDIYTSLFDIPIRSVYYSIPLPVGTMLVSIFMGGAPALLFAVVSSFIASLMLGVNLYYFIFFLLGSFVAVRGVEGCRDRATLVKTGLLVGAVNIVTVTSINMALEQLSSAGALFDACFALLGGIISGIAVTGLLPLAETAFGFTTNIKLLELANLDSPVLRDIMLRAPGTYYHSIVVGNLVEAAAKAIGANHLLAKVSAYYHDAGKTKKPDYFIENQRAGVNKHEKLAPSMSALILTSHVKDGVEIARKNKLGSDIINIIQQHHGTSLITYFYDKAVEACSNENRTVREENYRYAGPKPQTKEAGLVLLADSVEAASRTLQDPTPARMQGMVQKIINKIFSDGQLDECELTLKDLHQIAKSFNKVMNGIFHQRVEYSEPAEKGASTRKAKNGNSSRQSSTAGKDQPKETNGNDQEDLKRLGL
jgi:cyclic-di-AMP phosphodiesterase PgpH